MIIASIILGLVCIIHLFFCFMENEKWRKITKCLFIPCVIILLLTFKIESPYIYLGLLFGLLGDAFLIFNKKNKCFLMGIIAFSIGHVFYLHSAHLTLGHHYIWYLYLIAAFLMTVLVLVGYRIIHRRVKELTIPGLIYAGLLLTQLIAAVYLYGQYDSIYLLIYAIGAGMFIVSDSILTYANFYDSYKRYNFYVMFTYMIAEILIAIGLGMLIIN